MHATIARYFAVIIVGLWQAPSGAIAQTKEPLLDWKPDASIVARLGERFEDARISIQPPKNLKKANQPGPPELAAGGARTYLWFPPGVMKGSRYLSVILLPAPKPSSERLDDAVEGMQSSLKRGLEQAQFSETQNGRLGGVEVRSGIFSGLIAGEKIIAYYLIGNDKSGTFFVTAMLPYAEATPEEIAAVKTSILTFKRAASARR